MGTSREGLSKGIPLAQARIQMQIGHARATRRTFIFSDSKGVSYRLGYIQRGLERRDSIGTGTTSDADWACHGDEKDVYFFSDSRG